jgi:hypothetical protein
MSEEEVQIHDQYLNDWWFSLDWNTQNKINQLIDPLIKKSACDHEWTDPSTYENDLDKTKLYCFKCDSDKPKE